MLTLLQAILMGVVLGQFFVWAFSASKAYKKLKINLVSTKRMRLPLLNKVVSILLTLVVLITFTILVGASHDHPLINLIIFAAAWGVSALVGWRVAYGKHTDMMNSK